MVRTNQSLGQFRRGMMRASSLITTSSELNPRHEHYRVNQREDVCLNCIKDECNGNCSMIRRAKKERKNQK